MGNTYRVLAIFNAVMCTLLFLSSQFTLWWVQNLGDVIGNIGLIIDTHFPGSIEYMPSGRVGTLPLLNYMLIFFVIMVIGNVLVLLIAQKSKKRS